MYAINDINMFAQGWYKLKHENKETMDNNDFGNDLMSNTKNDSIHNEFAKIIVNASN